MIFRLDFCHIVSCHKYQLNQPTVSKKLYISDHFVFGIVSQILAKVVLCKSVRVSETPVHSQFDQGIQTRLEEELCHEDMIPL